MANWCNTAFAGLSPQAARLPYLAARAALYQQAQVLMHDEAPFFLIAHSVTFQPLRREVTGFVMSPLGVHSFDQVDLQ